MALDFLEMGPPSPQQMPQEQQQQQPAPHVGFIQGLLQKLQDPNVRTAMMQTGLNLMKSPGYGQNGWDVAANSLGMGLDTLQQLRERDRVQGIQATERKTKEEQRGIENERGSRQLDIAQQNANTTTANVSGDAAAKTVDQERADRALDEAIRHNKSSEVIDALRAKADNIRASAYSGNVGKTPAEVQKLDRLKKYAMTKLGMDDVDADKYAFDYLQTAKGKSPRQLVIDQFQKKVASWQESQFDPTAVPTPEMRAKWKQDAIEEVKFAEEAGKDVTDTRGVIERPPAPAATTPPAGNSSTPGVPSSSAAAPTVPGTGQAPAPTAPSSPATERSIEAWKLKGATPEQIKLLIATGGENPQTYGY